MVLTNITTNKYTPLSVEPQTLNLSNLICFGVVEYHVQKHKKVNENNLVKVKRVRILKFKPRERGHA